MASQNVTVSVDFVSTAVHDMVKENIDDNLKALDKSLFAAGKSARDYLKAHCIEGVRIHGKAGGSKRTAKSLSKLVRHYRSGWIAYHYRGIFYAPEKYQTALVIVGNAHVPTLSHLFEFGWNAGDTRISGNGMINAAYEQAASKVRGGAS